MMGKYGAPLSDLLCSPEPDINHIIPAFVSRFNAAYGNPQADRWDITKEEWQRYEFLGDRVLNLIIAQTLFVQRSTVLDEGEMTHILSNVVSNRSLDAFSRENETFVQLIPKSIGEQQTYGAKITGGAFEALIGALYCEVGFDDVACFVNTILADSIESVNPHENAIGELQEYFQKRGEPLPVYKEIRRSGPDHKPLFTVSVTLANGSIYEGNGASLSEARRVAAQMACENLYRQR